MPWYLISRLLYVSLGIYHWQHKMSFSAIFCLPIAGGQLKTFSKFLKNLFSKFDYWMFHWEYIDGDVYVILHQFLTMVKSKIVSKELKFSPVYQISWSLDVFGRLLLTTISFAFWVILNIFWPIRVFNLKEFLWSIKIHTSNKFFDMGCNGVLTLPNKNPHPSPEILATFLSPRTF